jgi:predicted enzyme involved in methoxymalonyl-ACP biosynthesis
MEKYVSFDTRINVVLLASKNTEESVNQKFREHEEMLNKINYLFNSYLKYE